MTWPRPGGSVGGTYPEPRTAQNNHYDNDPMAQAGWLS